MSPSRWRQVDVCGYLRSGFFSAGRAARRSRAGETAGGVDRSRREETGGASTHGRGAGGGHSRRDVAIAGVGPLDASANQTALRGAGESGDRRVAAMRLLVFAEY